MQHLVLQTPRQPRISAILTTVAAPVGFLHALPSQPDGCTGVAKTSEVASANGCLFASNGGVFDVSTGACLGNLISYGTVFQTDDRGFASWGLTADGRSVGYPRNENKRTAAKPRLMRFLDRWAFGQLGSATAAEAPLVEMLSGFIGSLLVDDFVGATSTNALVAQRTAVGIDAAGRLLVLTIDGAESPPRGMNLTELGAAFASLGARVAVNLDGGGSTSLWFNGSLANRPTCDDTPLPTCERAVASVLCVMPGV